MKKILLLDLEQTIISVWGNFHPIEHNCAKIREFNATFQADAVGLFSWAIWNQKDIDIWNGVKQDFELEMNLTFDHAWSIEEYIKLIKTFQGPAGMDNMDFFDFYDKEMCLFVLMINGWLDGYHVVLFDDVVKPCEVQFQNSKLTIHNITTFENN